MATNRRGAPFLKAVLTPPQRQLDAYYAEFAKAKAALYEDARRWKINLKTMERDGLKL